VGQLEGTEEKQESARGEGESQGEEEVANEEGKHEELKRDDEIGAQNEKGSQLEVKEGEQESAQDKDVPQDEEEVANEEDNEVVSLEAARENYRNFVSKLPVPSAEVIELASPEELNRLIELITYMYNFGWKFGFGNKINRIAFSYLLREICKICVLECRFSKEHKARIINILKAIKMMGPSFEGTLIVQKEVRLKLHFNSINLRCISIPPPTHSK
jgi:hypothetical protein